MHWVAPGTHDPGQTPPTHAWFEHATAPPHVPLVGQDSTPLSLHAAAPAAQTCGEPGAHPPWHEELPVPVTQACIPQSAGVPHWPLTQVCSPLPEHCVAPPEHDPEHCVPVHAPLAQGCAVPQLPVALQICTPVPMHWTLPGVHEPWHTAVPDVTTHAPRLHGVDAPHAPLWLHVWTPLPEHCVDTGAHTPTHPPATQAWLPQSMGAAHWPVESHCRAALPTQSPVPGAHAPPPSPDPSTVVSPRASSGCPSTVASCPESLESAPGPSDNWSATVVSTETWSAGASSVPPPLLPPP